MHLFRHFVALAVSFSSICAPALSRPATPVLDSKSAVSPRPLPLPVKVVHEFPKGTWVENLAVRKNDQILGTLIAPAAELYQVDPLSLYEPVLIHKFPTSSLFGIVEVEDDVFYVAAGDFSTKTFATTPGSYSVWEVDLRTFSRTRRTPATVRKIADFPDAVFLNGVTLLDKSKGLILIADSGLGVVWRLDVYSGEIVKVIDDPLMKPKAGSVPPLGINGLHIFKGTLYFSNLNFETFNQVAIKADGTAAAPATAISSGFGNIDDFIFDRKGNAYLNYNAQNSEVKLTLPEGKKTLLAGSVNDTTTLAGPTACAFGRSILDKTSLYITTTGGVAGYVTGNFTVGGTISRIDVGLDGYYG